MRRVLIHIINFIRQRQNPVRIKYLSDDLEIFHLLFFQVVFRKQSHLLWLFNNDRLLLFDDRAFRYFFRIFRPCTNDPCCSSFNLFFLRC